MFNPRDVIGPYTLMRNLGEGHFGVVWLAEHGGRSSHQEVAIKALKHPDSNMILQEVFNWAKAEGHPNILPILEARIYSTEHGEIPVIVSNYLQEGSLRSWMQQNQSISVATAVELSCSILDGVEHLHRKRIVHRDLKPENVLMYQGSPLLTDFGIARFQLTDTDVQTNVIAGTIPYMAPESFQGVRSPQVDVWAVAVMCYEMLAGRRPFPSDPYLIGNASLPPLPNSIPRELRKVLEFALRKDPTIRCYKSASELRAALLEAVATLQTYIRPASETMDASTIPMTPNNARTIEAQAQKPEAPVTGSHKVMDLSADSLKGRNVIFTNEEGQSDGRTQDTVRTNAKFGSVEAVEDIILTNRKET